MPNEVDELASRLEEANAQLQTRLEEEKGARREERFLWLIVVFALVDLVLFNKDESAGIVGVVGVFEFIILFVLARRLGIKNVMIAVDRVLTSVAGEVKPGKGD